MYEQLNAVLSDQKGGVIFTCFGIWHILYMLAIFGMILLVVQLASGKCRAVRQRIIDISICLAFGLYIADFFLMPFAYGEIDIEKLPFHMCTAMCVLCFLSRKNAFLGKWKTQFAVLGLISNLIYVVYPAGVGWYQIHPLSYRTVQTLLFHGAMTAHGIFVLALGEETLQWKKSYREFLIIVAMVLWALLGNTLYNGTAGDYSHYFNWFFVTQDPFYLLPKNVAPFVMPFVMILVMFTATELVYGVYYVFKKRRK